MERHGRPAKMVVGPGARQEEISSAHSHMTPWEAEARRGRRGLTSAGTAASSSGRRNFRLDRIYGGPFTSERRRKADVGVGGGEGEMSPRTARMAARIESDGRQFERTLAERGFLSRSQKTQKLVEDYIERCKDRPSWQAEAEVLSAGWRALTKTTGRSEGSTDSGRNYRGLTASAEARRATADTQASRRPSTTPIERRPSKPARENVIPSREKPLHTQYDLQPTLSDSGWEEHVKRQIAHHQLNRHGISMAQDKVRRAASSRMRRRDNTSDQAPQRLGGVGALIDALEGSLPATKVAVLETIPVPRAGYALNSPSPELAKRPEDTCEAFVKFQPISGRDLRKQREKSLASAVPEHSESQMQGSAEGERAGVTKADEGEESCEAEGTNAEVLPAEGGAEGGIPVTISEEGPAAVARSDPAPAPGNGSRGTESVRGGRGLTFRLVGSEITLIRMTLEANGFRRLGSKATSENAVFPDWTLLWSSSHLKAQTFMTLARHQKVNQFPKSYELTRKDRLCVNIEAMQQTFGLKRFSIIPESFVLPRDRDRFEDADRRDSSALWIIKPASDACGRGIFIVGGHTFRSRVGRGEFMEFNYIGVSHPSQGRVYNQIENRIRNIRDEETGMPMALNTSNPVVVSKYIANPLLVDGFKFDIRMYVCVMGFDPLRIFIYEEGLVRFAVEPYSVDTAGLNNMHAHLTNYSINKSHPNYTAGDRCDVEDPEGDGENVDDDIGHKWSLTALKKHFEAVGIDHAKIFRDVDDVIVKALLSVDHTMTMALKHTTIHKGNCFQLFGFDIMIDSALRPWLLEVNLSPSLSCDTPLDAKVKRHLIADLFSLVGMRKSGAVAGSDPSGDARLGLRTAAKLTRACTSGRRRASSRGGSGERDFASGQNPIRGQRSPIEPNFLSDFYSASLHLSRAPTNYYDRSRLSAGQRSMLRNADEELQRAPKTFRRIMPCEDPAELASYTRMLGVNRENDLLLAAHSLEKRFHGGGVSA